MSNAQSAPVPVACESIFHKWRGSNFYKEATVLGLDIGLEGIGVCVRGGQEILYAKTWAYDVPVPARLEDRRQLRAARHCRANRKTRLHRLRLLFEKHGLCWLDESSEAMRYSDPYILRHRAVASANGLASKEALSLAIRHCVAHRGHDYQYFNDEGSYPWGDATEFKKVMKELEKLLLTEAQVQRALADAEHFGWADEEVLAFRALVPSRKVTGEKMEALLAAHAKGDKNHVRIRAKGEAFPRTLVRAHLDRIIERHAHLIAEPDAFIEALFVRPQDAESKEAAIFYYHRKTKKEMDDHFKKKKARCGYAPWLGIADAKGRTPTVENGGNLAVRRWRLLEFAANRDIELETKAKKVVTRWRVPLGPALVKRLDDWLVANPESKKAGDISGIKDEIADALKTAHGGKPAAVGGKNGSDLNSRFFTTLRDLLAPSMANRNRNAPMCAAVAERLHAIATADGTDFTREGVNTRLKDCRPAQTEKGISLYDFRRIAAGDLYGVYPQVEFLMGQRVKKDRTRNGRTRGDLAVKGNLQLLFERELAPLLDGATAPDFCIAEVARDLPRNTKQKKERDEMIAANRERRKKLYAKYGYTDADKLSGIARSRIELHDQQGGLCPFTGEPLGDDPLAEDLDREHLFPESLGGLTVDENLVLTFARINRGEKKNRTPRDYTTHGGRPFEQMLAFTAKMRWGKFKREVFAWEDRKKIPEFGNTTRIAQLARQLHAEMGRWMGCVTAEDVERRIGKPTGFLTSACRRAWGLPVKDRADLTHHLVDAIILAHIPPREGQNYVQSGGIFFPSWDAEKRREVLDVLPLGPDLAVVAKLTAQDADACPILRHRSSSKSRRLHDKTLWRVLPDGSLAARTDGEFPAKEEIGSADDLRAMLVRMGIPATYKDRDGKDCDLIPSRDALRHWLDSDSTEPLRLCNGTPVKVAWKTAGKGNLTDDPMGFHARWNEQGGLQGVKSVLGRWHSLELWRGWNTKRQRWEYYKRLIPAPGVMKALRSLGYSWEKKSKRPWRDGAPELTAPLKKLLGGELPPYARPAVHPVTKEPVVFRTGDVFLVPLTREGKLAKRGGTSASHAWADVSAVMAEGGGRLRFLNMLTREKHGEPMSSDDLASLAGLPPADDPSSYPTQRPARPSRPDGKTDFRLE